MVILAVPLRARIGSAWREVASYCPAFAGVPEAVEDSADDRFPLQFNAQGLAGRVVVNDEDRLTAQGAVDCIPSQHEVADSDFLDRLRIRPGMDRRPFGEAGNHRDGDDRFEAWLARRLRRRLGTASDGVKPPVLPGVEILTKVAIGQVDETLENGRVVRLDLFGRGRGRIPDGVHRLWIGRTGQGGGQFAIGFSGLGIPLFLWRRGTDGSPHFRSIRSIQPRRGPIELSRARIDGRHSVASLAAASRWPF